MKFTSRTTWRILFGLAMIVLSALLYLADYTLFGNPPRILTVVIESIASLPIYVFFVILIAEAVLEARERNAMLNKMNMPIGVFFSQVGVKLLRTFTSLDAEVSAISNQLMITAEWSEKQFAQVGALLHRYPHHLQTPPSALQELQELLVCERSFLLSLLANPNLLEHETFTELLRAVFHLAEELTYRTDVYRLSKSDYAHLAFDAKRAYSRLTGQWLDYMHYLKRNYPYLFSLSMRTNPFDPNARPEFPDEPEIL
jgi:hypothetical protein